jgi:hypothetical protein
MKRGVIDSLISEAKLICWDQKDFRNEIKSISHDLMDNEYQQEFVDFLMKIQTWDTVSVSGSFSKLNVHSLGH